jgi:hypothetical protein
MRTHIKYSPRLLPSDPNSPVIGSQLVAQLLQINTCTLNIWCREGKVEASVSLDTPNGVVRRWSLNDIEKLRQRLIYKS